MQKSWLFFLFFIFQTILFTQDSEIPVTWQIKTFSFNRQEPNDIFMKINVFLQDEYWIYGPRQHAKGPFPLKIEMKKNPVFIQTSPIRIPGLQRKYDKGFEMEVEYLQGNSEIIIPVKFKPEKFNVELISNISITYSVCNNEVCYPPRTNTLFFRLQQAGSQYQIDQILREEKTSDTTKKATLLMENGIASFLGFAFLMGLLSLLTPCVFPLIPLTLSLFKQKTGKRSGMYIGKSLIFVTGIIFTFTLIGLSITFFFGASGMNRLAAHPVTNLAISSILIFFALSLFGLIQIALPAPLITRMDKFSKSIGILSPLFIGISFSVSSFACTLPFVGAVCIGAVEGTSLWPVIGLFVYGLAFALPFFTLSLFPGLLTRFPHAGNWMKQFEIIIGLFALGISIKYVDNAFRVIHINIMKRPVFLIFWSILALILAFYLIYFFNLKKFFKQKTIVKIRRLLLAAVFILISVYFSKGIFKTKLGIFETFLPQTDNTWQFTKNYYNDFIQAADQAEKQNKNILIFFTGYTCTNCKWMKQNIISQSDVQSALKEFIIAELYVDGIGEKYAFNRQLQEDKFHSIALPLFIILNPAQTEISRLEVTIKNEQKFIEFLNITNKNKTKSLMNSFK